MNTVEYYPAIREEWNCANCNNIDKQKQKQNKLTQRTETGGCQRQQI